jgi:hypothetical protein
MLKQRVAPKTVKVEVRMVSVMPVLQYSTLVTCCLSVLQADGHHTTLTNHIICTTLKKYINPLAPEFLFKF